MDWNENFKQKMNQYALSNSESMIPISIKIRPSGGCFHREHSPQAYQIIDNYIESHPTNDYIFEEHETGPEIISMISAGINITSSVINFITAIIKARTEGIRRGDHKDAPLELIIRGYDKKGNLKQEEILTIKSWQEIDDELIEKVISVSIEKLFFSKKKEK